MAEEDAVGFTGCVWVARAMWRPEKVAGGCGEVVELLVMLWRECCGELMLWDVMGSLCLRREFGRREGLLGVLW